MSERQALSAATTHSGTAVKQAMSLKGQALMVISALPPETSWDKLLQALKIKHQDKASYDVLMAQFYGTKIEPDEKCASFGTRLEQKLNQVSFQYPNKISESMYWNCVRERFFHGLSKCHELKEILWVPNFLLYLSNMLSTVVVKELRVLLMTDSKLH